MANPVNDLKVFKVKISYNDAEGWWTLNPVVYAYNESEVEEIILSEYFWLSNREYSMEITEVFPRRGIIL